MNAACLNDPDVFPDDAVLGAHLGKSMEQWRSFVEAVRTDHASLAVEWRYYNDGKAWLCKVVRKKKAMCWVSVWPSLFRITFFFGARNTAEVVDSHIGQSYKDAFLAQTGTRKFPALTVDVKTKKALKDALELLGLRERLP
jgi:hypothetical protein